MAIDPKHLPDDPKALQQMVLDLMAQLDREFTERGKVETLLRELLDAKRNRPGSRSALRVRGDVLVWPVSAERSIIDTR